MEENWIAVYTTDQLYKAEIACQLLDEEGIETIKMNRHDSTFNSFGDIEVMVRSEDVQKALDIIKNTDIGNG